MADVLLSRDDILGSDDLRLERVDVPEWNGVLYVRVMTAGERDQFEAEVAGVGKRSKNMSNLRARLVCLVGCDENGQALFEKGDAAALGAKSAAAVDRVFTVAARLNGFTSQDIDELEGESEPAQ
jgi:hypothetical protein